MMLSRVAENLYWMARYLERAEATARLVTTSTHLALDLPRNFPIGWEPLIAILGSREEFYERNEKAEEYEVMRFLISDDHHSGSIVSSLRAARQNARVTRDIVSQDTWEQVNELYYFATARLPSAASRSARFELLRHVIRGCQQIMGSINGSMSRDEAFYFLRLGRALEQADMTTRIVDVRALTLLPHKTDDSATYAQIAWMSVLKSLSAYQMYRRHVQARVTGPAVLRFLLRDRHFPQSVAYCLNLVEECLERLPSPEKPLETVYSVRALALDSDVDTEHAITLHHFIDDLQKGFDRIHASIQDNYFWYSASSLPEKYQHKGAAVQKQVG